MNKTGYIIILSTAVGLASDSCRKKDEPLPPVVTLYTPSNGSNFTVGDTVYVSGNITDQIPLQNIGINLLNDQYQSASVGITLATNKSDFSLSYTFIINDLELATGTYYICITASDGVNTTSDYIRINLTAIPEQRTGIYLVTAADNSSIQVALVDSAHNAKQFLTLSGDYSSAAISSLYQQLYVCGKYSGSLNAINLKSNSIAWSIPAAITSFPVFEDISYANGVTYTSYYNGNIIGYNNVQSAVFTAASEDAFFPIDILNYNGNFLVEQHQISGNSEILVEYYPAGASFQNAPLDAKPVQMFTLDQNDAMLFGNNASQGVIEIYNSQTNNIRTVATCDSVNDVIQLNVNNYVLALTTGVYEYDYSNILSPFIPARNATSIAYDNVNNEMFAAVGNTLNVYNASGSGLLYSVNASEPIKKVLLLFNK